MKTTFTEKENKLKKDRETYTKLYNATNPDQQAIVWGSECTGYRYFTTDNTDTQYRHPTTNRYLDSFTQVIAVVKGLGFTQTTPPEPAKIETELPVLV